MTGARLARPPAQRITLAQLVVLALLACLLWISQSVSPRVIQSFLAGGLIAVLPQAWFAAKLFRHTGAQSAKAVVRSAYVGETGKYLFSIAGFAALFALVEVDARAVFGAYLLMLIVQLLGSALLLRQFTQ